MSASIFEAYLATAESSLVFSDRALLEGMLRFERALVDAQADEGLIPAASAQAIAAACKPELYDAGEIVDEARTAGSLAVPLINALRKQVPSATSQHVHLGATTQDVLDTALVLAIGQALALLDRDLGKIVVSLLKLGEVHAATPMLARTLMQPAQVITFGLKALNWAAPVVRSRAHLRSAARRALVLQLGGAAGTLSELGRKAEHIARRTAEALGLGVPAAPWHTQRDELLRLGAEVAIVIGSLGKIATDLALLGQAEVGEVAEPAAPGRGTSSAMPHKRNPVSSLVALAAAKRSPQRLAALAASMTQEHERGLGTWQAELAEWPGLMTGAHASAMALAEALSGLSVDATRMLANIEAARIPAGDGVDAAAAIARRRHLELRAQYAGMEAAPWGIR